MLENLLPDRLLKAVSLLNFDDLCEIRLRLDRPITVGYKNTYYFLGCAGLCREADALKANKTMISEIVSRASNFSVYAVNEELKDGFLAVKNGVRIGITGTVVVQGNEILTMKDISSLNIRIPHQIVGASYKISKLIYDADDKVLNTLIIGAPGTGKTTILRDLCVQINKRHKDSNILLLDERFEIAGTSQGVPQLNVGSSTDILSGGKKYNNVINGIRSMSPDIIVLDEIGTSEDILSVEYAVNCGVNLIASVHSKDIFEFQKKIEFEKLINAKSFKRYVVVSTKSGKGTIENVYDEQMRPLLRFI